MVMAISAADATGHSARVLACLIVNRDNQELVATVLELLALGVPVGEALVESSAALSNADHGVTTSWREAMDAAKQALGEDAWDTNLCTYALRHQWGLPQPTYERRLQKNALCQRRSWLVTGESPTHPQ